MRRRKPLHSFFLQVLFLLSLVSFSTVYKHLCSSELSRYGQILATRRWPRSKTAKKKPFCRLTSILPNPIGQGHQFNRHEAAERDHAGRSSAGKTTLCYLLIRRNGLGKVNVASCRWVAWHPPPPRQSSNNRQPSAAYGLAIAASLSDHSSPWPDLAMRAFARALERGHCSFGCYMPQVLRLSRHSTSEPLDVGRKTP